jgi:hypothetical protein
MVMVMVMIITVQYSTVQYVSTLVSCGVERNTVLTSVLYALVIVYQVPTVSHFNDLNDLSQQKPATFLNSIISVIHQSIKEQIMKEEKKKRTAESGSRQRVMMMAIIFKWNPENDPVGVLKVCTKICAFFCSRQDIYNKVSIKSTII